MMSVTTSLMVVLATYIFLRALLYITQDAKEPHAVNISIPFVSPLFSLWRHGSKFFLAKCDLPIYTLRLPGARVYVVNSTALISAIQRETRTISFEPIFLKAATGIMGLSQTAVDIISHDLANSHALVKESGKITSQSLSPSFGLYKLNDVALRLTEISMNNMTTGEDPVIIHLYRWIGEQLTKITSETIYGGENPLKDPANAAIWQQFMEGMVYLVAGFIPEMTIRKYIRAREALAFAFMRYYREGRYNNPETSELIKKRYELYREKGMPLDDIARHEVAFSLALLTSTIPTTFWLLYHIFSDPAVLQSCRDEVSGAVKEEEDGSYTLDMNYVKESCPILFSTFKETLRVYGSNTAARIVTDDTLVSDKYLLREGGIVLIPSMVQHSLKSTWGDDASDFNYQRFLHKPGSKKKRYDPVAFRSFGGGSVICPGRYFATTEILALASLMMLRFNARPRCGKWPSPTVEKSNPGLSVLQPDEDIELELCPRDSRKWNINLRDKAQEMLTKDMSDADIEAGF